MNQAKVGLMRGLVAILVFGLMAMPAWAEPPPVGWELRAFSLSEPGAKTFAGSAHSSPSRRADGQHVVVDPHSPSTLRATLDFLERSNELEYIRRGELEAHRFDARWINAGRSLGPTGELKTCWKQGELWVDLQLTLKTYVPQSENSVLTQGSHSLRLKPGQSITIISFSLPKETSSWTIQETLGIGEYTSRTFRPVVVLLKPYWLGPE